MPTNPSPARTARRSLTSVLGLTALGIGLVLVFVGYKSGGEERALSRQGRVVQGTVDDKRIDHTTRPKKGWGTGERTVYVVHYVFPVGPGTGQEGEQAIDEALWRTLRQGGHVPVRYLPADPATNRLDAVPLERTDVYLPLGALLAVGGLVILYAGIRRARRAGQGRKDT